MVPADASAQSGQATFVRDDNDSSSSTMPFANVEDEIERLRKIIAEYDSTRKGMFMFHTMASSQKKINI